MSQSEQGNEQTVVVVGVSRSREWLAAQRLATGANVPETIDVRVPVAELSEAARAILLHAGSGRYPEKFGRTSAGWNVGFGVYIDSEAPSLPEIEAALVGYRPARIEQAVQDVLGKDALCSWSDAYCAMYDPIGPDGKRPVTVTEHQRPYLPTEDCADEVWADPRVVAHEAQMRVLVDAEIEATKARAAERDRQLQLALEARKRLQPELDAAEARADAAEARAAVLAHALGLLPPDAMTGLVRALAAEEVGEAEADAERQLCAAMNVEADDDEEYDDE